MILFRSFLFINHIYTGQIFKYKNIFGWKVVQRKQSKKLYNHTYFVFLCMSDLEHFSGDVGSIYFFGCFIIDDNFFFQDFSRSEFKRRLLVYD